MTDRSSGGRDETPSGRKTSYRPAAGENPSIAVISAVSDHTGAEPLELPPLYDAVDADALDRLFTSTASRTTYTTFRFHFADTLVTVSGEDGFEVEVEPLDEG